MSGDDEITLYVAFQAVNSAKTSYIVNLNWFIFTMFTMDVRPVLTFKMPVEYGTHSCISGNLWSLLDASFVDCSKKLLPSHEYIHTWNTFYGICHSTWSGSCQKTLPVCIFYFKLSFHFTKKIMNMWRNMFWSSVWPPFSLNQCTILRRSLQRPTSGCRILSLHWRPVGGLRLLSALWSDCCLFDIFPISILNFTCICLIHRWKHQLKRCAHNYYSVLYSVKNLLSVPLQYVPFDMNFHLLYMMCFRDFIKLFQTQFWNPQC